MTEVKHIAGPWKVSKANPHRVIVAEGDKVGLDIAEANHFVGAYRDISLANARLIAAAPDLLDALKAVVANSTYETPGGYENCRFCDNNMDHEGTFKDMHDPDCEIRKAKAAIAKAEART